MIARSRSAWPELCRSAEQAYGKPTLAWAPAIGFGIFIVSAPTPFRPEDCAELIRDAPAVVARYFPDYPALYRRRGWSMLGWIDRIYLSARAEAVLGFRCRTGFAEVLAALDAQGGMVNPPWAPQRSFRLPDSLKPMPKGQPAPP